MLRRKEAPGKVSEVVRKFMVQRPLLLKYAMDGLVNTSALARAIKKETGLKKSDDTVMVSLYRFLTEFKGIPKIEDRMARQILEETAANIRSDYAVAVVEGAPDFKADVEIYFGRVSVFIGEAKSLRQLKTRAVFYRDSLALIELRHKENIEDIPGVLFYIIAKFYEKNISIVEVFSAWDSTYILIDKKNVKDVFEMFFAKD